VLPFVPARCPDAAAAAHLLAHAALPSAAAGEAVTIEVEIEGHVADVAQVRACEQVKRRGGKEAGEVRA